MDCREGWIVTQLCTDVIAELEQLRRDVDQRPGVLLQKLNGAQHPDNTVPDRPFRGRPMVSKRQSTCAVCGQQIKVDDDIVYNGDLRRAAHLGCGQPILRGAK